MLISDFLSDINTTAIQKKYRRGNLFRGGCDNKIGVCS